MIILKNACFSVCILGILFMTGCSNSEHLIINNKDQDALLTVNLQQSNMETEDEYDMDISVKSERLNTVTNHMNWQDNDILSFENILFLRNTEYKYEDGEYHRSGKKLTDYLPEEDQKKLLESITNNTWRILQSNNAVIYSIYEAPEEYRVTFVDFPTGEILCSCILPAEIQCVYEKKIYYISTKEDRDGIKIYSIEYLNCDDQTSHVIYSTPNILGQMMVREDGDIAFAEYDGGYYIIDADGNLEQLHEPIKDRLSFAKEQFCMFDDTGLYFWIEYYNKAMELIHIDNDGTLYRLRSDFTQNEIVLNQGMLIYDKNEANLYPHQYETMDISDLPMREEINWPPPLKKYQIIDLVYINSGFSLINKYYYKNTIWWLWKDNDERLIITKSVLE